MPPDMRAALIGAVLALGAPLAAGANPLADSGQNRAPAVETGSLGVQGQPAVREVDHRGFRHRGSHHRGFRHRDLRDRDFRHRGFDRRGFRGKAHRRHHSGSRHFLHRPRRAPDIFFHPKRFHDRGADRHRFHHKRFRHKGFRHRNHRGHRGFRHRGPGLYLFIPGLGVVIR